MSDSLVKVNTRGCTIESKMLSAHAANSSSIAYCACGELRRASLAPAIFESMRSKLPRGDWFLVSSGQASLDGNDKTATAETRGLCVPAPLAAWASINSTAHNDTCHQKLSQHLKTQGSYMRLQKMTRCVLLVKKQERSRDLRYAFLFFTRPDLYLCSVSRFNLTALPEQRIMIFGPRVGRGAQADDGVVDSVRDHLIAARRETALSLVRHLTFDVADWFCSVQDVASSLAPSCPVHESLGRSGDATLECWIGRRMQANHWRATYVKVDFTLLRTNTDTAEGARYGSARCALQGRSHQPDPACHRGRPPRSAEVGTGKRLPVGRRYLRSRGGGRPPRGA